MLRYVTQVLEHLRMYVMIRSCKSYFE